MGESIHESAERVVADLIRRLASRFEHAEVEGPTPDPPAGMRIGLSCTVPGTARIRVYPSGDDIIVCAGVGSQIEIWKSRREPIEARLPQLEAILQAMVGGRFEERVWRRKDTVVKSYAILRRPNGRRFLKSAGAQTELGIFTPGKVRTTIKYAAYA